MKIHQKSAGRRYLHAREPLHTEIGGNHTRRVCKRGDQKVNRSIESLINFGGNLIDGLFTIEVWAVIQLAPHALAGS